MAALGVECVSSFAVDFWLQTHLFQAGILWYMLGYLFNYDYTLEESGIQKSEETNQQVTLTALILHLNSSHRLMRSKASAIQNLQGIRCFSEISLLLFNPPNYFLS